MHLTKTSHPGSLVIVQNEGLAVLPVPHSIYLMALLLVSWSYKGYVLSTSEGLIFTGDHFLPRQGLLLFSRRSSLLLALHPENDNHVYG